MAVLMLGIGGLVGNTDGEKSEHRGNQIESGMRRFGKDAQAASSNPDGELKTGDDHGGQDGVPRGRAFFRAHQIRWRNRRRARHGGIIAGLRH